MLAQRRAPVLGQRHAVAGRGALATEEGRPVVVEVAEHGGHVDGAALDVAQTHLLEERRQRLGPADREAPAFVKLRRCRIQRHRRVPEPPHELHLAGVVPDVDRHRATRPHRAPHLGQRARLGGDEVEHEP